jgi:hypothetical protein
MKKFLILLITITSSIFAFAQTEIKLSDIANHEGDSVIVSGIVMDCRHLPSAKGSPVLLNVGAKYPNQLLTLVIWGDDRSKFKDDPEKTYMNKNVRMAGKVEMYKGKPQIVLHDEKQITIISEDQ